MSLFLALSGVIGTVSMMAVVFVLAQLSRRLGAVTRLPSFYRYYFVSIFFLTWGTLSHILVATAYLQPENIPPLLKHPLFLFVAYHLPLSLGLTISLVVTWLYWRWLITER